MGAAITIACFLIHSWPVRAGEAISADLLEKQMATPDEVFAAMRNNFRPEKAKGIHARYQFNISGPKGGQWSIVVSDGAFTLDKRAIPDAQITIVASDDDWVQLAKGTLGGIHATLMGRLKVIGDPRIAHKLDDLFPWAWRKQ